jgi:hypothetical protein
MRDRKPDIYVWFLGFLVFWFPRFPDSNPANQKTSAPTRRFWFPVRRIDLYGVLCGTTQHHFRDFQIHFVEQRFGSPGKLVGSAGHTKLPSLLRKSAPDRCRDER